MYTILLFVTLSRPLNTDYVSLLSRHQRLNSETLYNDYDHVDFVSIWFMFNHTNECSGAFDSDPI